MTAPEVPAELQKPHALREVRRRIEMCQTSIDRCMDLMKAADLGITYLEWCQSDLRKARHAVGDVAATYNIDLMGGEG